MKGLGLWIMEEEEKSVGLWITEEEEKSVGLWMMEEEGSSGCDFGVTFEVVGCLLLSLVCSRVVTGGFFVSCRNSFGVAFSFSPSLSLKQLKMLNQHDLPARFPPHFLIGQMF